MKLLVLTPTRTVLETDEVARVRAEDTTGKFGIHSGHEDFVTALGRGVLVYAKKDGADRYVAVGGGVLSVEGGRLVRVLAREAAVADDLHELEARVRRAFRERSKQQKSAAAGLSRLELALVSRLQDFVRPDRGLAAPAAVPERGAP